MTTAHVLVAAVAITISLGCQDPVEVAPTSVDTASTEKTSGPRQFAQEYPTFGEYWYRGRAELTRYALRQHRYEETHDGEAVLIFVTEDFLSKLQVKRDHGETQEAVSILKLNAYRRFYTGIYPYTIMTSSFTPARRPGVPTLKVTNTVQEWCGQTFTQINRRQDGLRAVMYSYVQDEGDQKLTLPNATLEDGLWAQIRIDPKAIPEGKQEIVPGLDYIRLQHKALRAYPAVVRRTASARTDLLDQPIEALEIEYPALARTLAIYYETEFPHAIVAWEEKVGPQRTTGVRTDAIIDDYWNHNSADDGAYREALGLTF